MHDHPTTIHVHRVPLRDRPDRVMLVDEHGAELATADSFPEALLRASFHWQAVEVMRRADGGASRGCNDG